MARTLGVLTALHGRQEISCRMLRHATWAPPGWSVRIGAAYSRIDSDWAEPVLTELGAVGVCVQNNPVSFKWQAGLTALRESGPLDGLMILGSDDFASRTYVEQAARLLELWTPFPVGPNRVWMVSPGNGLKAGLFKSEDGSGSIGAGRVFPIPVLNRLDWILWDKPKDMVLDGMCGRRCAERGIRIEVMDMPGEIFDVKTEENIHGFADFENWLGAGVSRLNPLLDAQNTTALLQHHGVFDAILGNPVEVARV